MANLAMIYCVKLQHYLYLSCNRLLILSIIIECFVVKNVYNDAFAIGVEGLGGKIAS